MKRLRRPGWIVAVNKVAWLAAAGFVAAVILGSGASGAPVSGSDVLYTVDADFDQGLLVNVNHTAPNTNQLQLNTTSGTFPFIWVATSQRCTISKVNTTTGAILGEYRTVSDDANCAESSRTTVALDGSVWVGHRGPGGVTHVGLAELNECLDRNGNGTIETSSGYGDVKAWAGSSSTLADAQDECIIHHVDTNALGLYDSRHMSVDKNNKLWVGDYAGGHNFVRINGTTGAAETTARTFACGGYGGLIDSNGVIWSSNGSNYGLLRWDPNAPDSEGTNPRCIPIPIYGLAIDRNGYVWATELYNNAVRKVSPDGNTVSGPFNHGSYYAQGLAVTSDGDVWVSASTLDGQPTVGHLKNDGTFVGNVDISPSYGSTGVSVDANGNVWTANRLTNTATRINPAGGPTGADGVTPVGALDLTVSFPATAGRPLPYPYNYSDMTGAQLLSSTATQGSWTVTQDSGAPETAWGKIVWNTESQASLPSGTEILVEARAADSEAALGGQTFAPVGNATPFTLIGRFIEVRLTLKPNGESVSPVLSDIRICSAVALCDAAPPPVTTTSSTTTTTTTTATTTEAATTTTATTTEAAPATTTIAAPPPPPPPTEPRSFNGQVTRGTVLLNGQPIVGTVKIASGDILDARNGTIEIVTDGGRARFFEGAFRITQSQPNAVTVLELVGGDFGVCTAAARAQRSADRKPVRRLWGSGTGKFQTKARYNSATVRGTLWLTEDDCEGSLTRSEEGVVSVLDFSLRRTFAVNPGQEYLAKPPPPPTPGRFIGEPKGQVLVNGQPVDQNTQIRNGDRIDVRNGSIELTTTSGKASFYSGVFTVEQIGGANTYTELTLVGGNFSACGQRKLAAKDPPKPRKAGNSSTKTPVRSLWGKGTGKFRTKSRYSSATVRGTTWLSVDRCDGSLTVVRAGIVEVYDFALRRTVLVHPGEEYLARAPGN